MLLAYYSVQSILSGVAFGFLTNATQSQEGDTHLLTVYVGIAAISLLVLVLIVAGVIVALIILGLKAKAAAIRAMGEVKGKLYPIIEKTDALVVSLSPTIQSIAEKTDSLIGELSPKFSGITEDVRSITGNVEQMSSLMKKKLEEFSPTLSAVNQTIRDTNETIQDANRRTHQQVERMNGMVSSVLDKAVELSEALARAVQVPVKGMAGFATTLKYRLDSLFSRVRPATKRV